MLFDDDRNPLLNDRRFVGNVEMIPKYELKCVFTRGELQIDLGLPHPEMPVVVIRRDRKIIGWGLGVDDQMMMPGRLLGHASRSDTHLTQAEADPDRRAQLLAVFRRDEVDLSAIGARGAGDMRVGTRLSGDEGEKSDQGKRTSQGQHRAKFRFALDQRRP